MKKVALIMESWKQYFTSAWPQGFATKIEESEEDVSLYIFNSSDGLSRTLDFQTGEYNIFRLPDFSDFDGVILDVNNIHSKSIHEEVVNRIRKSGIPAISIASRLDGFYYVGIDNYAVMKRMIAHLHQVHGCTDFRFVMGPSDNFETRERARALHDYLAEQGLPAEEDRFYYESYEYDCGVHGFEAYLKSGRPMPHAFVCGNDNIAVGVCESAKRQDFRIPDDFIVTGFDDFDKASYYIPRITTVSHIREEVGYQSAELFLNLWKGEAQEQAAYTWSDCLFQESCGCTRDHFDARERLRDRVLSSIEEDHFEEKIVSLDFDLSRCKSIPEMMQAILPYVEPMNCKGFYLMLDDVMNQTGSFLSEEDRRKLMFDSALHTIGYPEQMRVMLAWENGHRCDWEGKMINGLDPYFVPEESDQYLFLPVHFKDKTVGVAVVRHPIPVMLTNYLFQVMASLTTALENFHRQEILENMNTVLTNLYIKDGLTGLFNRLGLQRFRPDFVKKNFEKGKDILVIFIDLDRLKVINDTLGHNQGDFAIITVSQSIFKYVGKDAIPARTGGDEFVIVETFESEAATEKLLADIKNDIAERGQMMQFPIPLSVSAGYSVLHHEETGNFESAIREADDMMYREKLSKHVERS